MSFPERDLKAKLDDMEADLNQKAADPADSFKSVLPKLEIDPSPQVQEWIDQSKSIFNSLPQFGKVAVVIGGVWLGFSVVGAVLHVVTSLFTVAAVGVVLYIAYRLFNNDSAS